MTVLEVLNAAAGYLGKHGVESPRLNAEHLLAHVLGKKRLDLYLEFDRPLSDAEREPLRHLIRERGAGRPLQHLLGTAEFFGRTFLCDGRGLIPRPETEQLVELVKAAPAAQKAGSRILDCGTGSGILAITLALELPSASVTAVDISPEALALAQENAHKLEARIAFAQADLLPEDGGPFDVIVANLPYIPTGDLAGLQKEVSHDPVLALDGGADGLEIIRRLIPAGRSRLNPGGAMWLEIGHDQAAQVAELFRSQNYTDVTVAPDFQGIERFVGARSGSPDEKP